MVTSEQYISFCSQFPFFRRTGTICYSGRRSSNRTDTRAVIISLVRLKCVDIFFLFAFILSIVSSLHSFIHHQEFSCHLFPFNINPAYAADVSLSAMRIVHCFQPNPAISSTASGSRLMSFSNSFVLLFCTRYLDMIAVVFQLCTSQHSRRPHQPILILTFLIMRFI